MKRLLFLLLGVALLPCYANEGAADANSEVKTEEMVDESTVIPEGNDLSYDQTIVSKENSLTEIQPQDILDLRPFVVTPKNLIPYAVFGACLLLLLVLYFILKKRKPKAISIIPLSPYDRALQEIEATREWIHESQPKRFASGLSDAVREYMESVFRVRAIESTTEELLHEMQPLKSINSTLKKDLKAFLENCDIIKFTKETILPKGREELYASAKQWIKAADKIRQAEAMTQTNNVSLGK